MMAQVADALQLLFDAAVENVPEGIAHLCTMPLWETAELLTFIHQVLATKSVRWATTTSGSVPLLPLPLNLTFTVALQVAVSPGLTFCCQAIRRGDVMHDSAKVGSPNSFCTSSSEQR